MTKNTKLTKLYSLVNPPLPLPRPRRSLVRHPPGPGFPLLMVIRRQRQRQFLLRHHAGVESGVVDSGDGFGICGAEG